MARSLNVHSFMVNLLILGAGFASSAMLARWLEPAGRGEIAAAMLWPNVVIYLACLGMMEAILYFAALPGADPRPIFATSLAIAIVQSLMVLPPAYLAMPWLLSSQSPDVIDACRLLLLIVPISLITQYNISILHAGFQIRWVNYVRLLIPAGTLAGIGALHAGDRLAVLTITLLHLGLNLVLLCLTTLRLRPVLSFAPDVRLARRMLRYGFAAHVGSVSQGAQLKLDQLVLAGFFAPTELGLYVVAVSATSPTQALSTAITNVLRPFITRQSASANQDDRLRAGLRQYWTASVVLTLAVGVAIVWAIPTVFGDEFARSIWPAEILLVAALFAGAKEVLAGGTRARGDAWLSSKADIVAAAVTIVTLVLLLPTFGILGAALATLIASICALACIVRDVSRTSSVASRELLRFDYSVRRSLVSSLRLMRISRGAIVAISRTDQTT